MPSLESEFTEEPSPILVRLRELEEAAGFLARDMIKISRGEVKDPAKFALESLRGTAMIVVPK